VRTYLAQEQLLIPARPPRGPAPHDTIWTLPKSSTILRIVHNPAYAGAYVHGQRTFDPARQRLGELPVEQWPICIQNVYPAYISWETYLANRKRLQTNRNLYSRDGHGVPGKGKALLQGIIVCGCCGRHMGVGYSGPRGDYPVYRCAADARDYGGKCCQEVRGPGIDAAVEQLVLAALEPDRIRLAVDALEQLELEAKALDTQWQLRLERVRFEAHRAQRQYQAVEPENRLVARHLEQLWEEKLRGVEATEQEYTTWRHEHRAEITAEERHAILAIGENLSSVWYAPTTTMADRKHLLRLVVKEIIADQRRLPGKLWFQINWQTGAGSTHEIVRYGVSYHHYIDGQRIEARIRQLYAARKTDKQIAATLNAEGYRTTRGGAFNPQTVWLLRKGWNLASVKVGEMTADGLRWRDGAYTIRGVMLALGVEKSTVHRWVQQGRLHGHHDGPYMPWRFTLTQHQLRTLRRRVRRKGRSAATLAQR
jgi:hypothetical protein